MGIAALDLMPWSVVPFLPIISLIDWGVGENDVNLDPRTPESKLIWHNIVLYLWFFLHPATIVLVVWQIVHSQTLTGWECAILIVMLGQTAALCVAAGHELLHRRTRTERYMGEFLLSTICFPHWHTEHVMIHHALVSTPGDPVTAPPRRNFYPFLFWGVIGNQILTWKWQKDRLARRGLPFWDRTNPYWRWLALWAFWPALMWFLGGWHAIGLFFLQAGIGIVRLRVVDYIEHYGLMRMRLPNGRFEKVAPRHSWNTSYSLSNLLLFNLQRHSDHHRIGSRPYPLLQNYSWDEAPQLPFNYLMLSFVALVPPLWFRIMDPRLDRWRRQFYPEIEDWRPYESALYRKHPEAIGTIAEVMTGAPRHGAWMERQPALLDSIRTDRFAQLDISPELGFDPDEVKAACRGLLRLYYAREYTVPEMKEELDAGEAQTWQDAVSEAQIWGNEEAFKLGVRMMRGHILPHDAGPALSNMADTAIGAVTGFLLEEQEARYGMAPGGMAVLALGDLGDRDSVLNADVRLAIVHDGAANGAEAGSKLAPDVYWSRFATRFVQATGRKGLSLGNILFHSIDVCALPANSSGAAACTLQDLADFDWTGGSGGDLADIVSARVVCSRGDAAVRFERTRSEILDRIDHRDAPASLPADGREGERSGRRLQSLLEGPGGLGDVRRGALHLRLSDAGDIPETGAGGLSSVFETAAARDVIAPDIADRLAQAARFWLNLRGILALSVEGGDDEAAVSDPVKSTIATALDADDFDAACAAAADVAAGAAADVQAVLRTTGGR